jgi:hypothetical protein
MDAFLQNAGFDIKLPSWDIGTRKNRRFIDSVTRQMYPKLSSTQRNKLVEYAGPTVSAELSDMLRDASQLKTIDIGRDLISSSSFRTRMDGFKTSLERNLGAELKNIDRGANQYLSETPVNPTRNASQMKLRQGSKNYLPGTSTGKEPISQSVSDIVQADLFSYQPPNPELGENNSLYLDNQQNDQILSGGDALPISVLDIAKLVGVAPIIPQWRSEQDVEREIDIRIHDAMVSNAFHSLPPVSITLNDQNEDQSHPSYLMPIVQTGRLAVYNQGVPLGELNRIGFKRQSVDMLRQPDKKTRVGLYVQPTTPIDAFNQIEEDGYNYMETTGKAWAPLAQTTVLRDGSHWLSA